MLQPNLTLDGNYTAIGRVISGMEFVDALTKGEPPENPSKIVHASIESDDQGIAPVAFVPPPPAAAPVTTAKKAKKDKKAKPEAVKPALPVPAEPAPPVPPQAEAQPSATDQGTDAAVREVSGQPGTASAVSYTHLTLPTKRIV